MELNPINSKNFQYEDLVGIISMGLIIMWINAFPCFGPILSVLNLPFNYFPQIFIIAHGAGLYTGAMIYGSSVSLKMVAHTGRTLVVITAGLSVLLLYHQFFNYTVITSVYTVMSLLSGLIVIRWMIWFSSERIAGRRGAILGKTVCITYILLSLNNYVMAALENGLSYAMVFSASAILVGGFFTFMLPVSRVKMLPIPLKALIPPVDILLMGLLSYGAISLIYSAIFINQARYSILPWLLIVPYLFISLVLTRLSDYLDRQFLIILGFLFCGIGFLFYTGGYTGVLSDITFSVLMSAGLLCIHYYYWLSLVDRQNHKYAPYLLITGVLFELIIVAIGITVAPLLSAEPELKREFVGMAGLIFTFLGLFSISAFIYYRFLRLNSSHRISLLKSWSGSSFNNKIGALPSVYIRFSATDQELLAETITKEFNLTKRELQVAMLLFVGYKSSYISEVLAISPNTVKFHLKNILTKIGAPNREIAAEKVLNVIEHAKSYL